ncbi:MAG: ABC transporter substrate-binding protein, partial [Proteobacteria bacterium]|nr:ABC transporter substrate-binding protein [Pseudomonadota bacterium]
MTQLRHTLVACAWLVCAMLANTALTAGERLHGYALLGELKYPADFKHFDYVNPLAPKGGDVRQSATGGYDSLNPFILKGRAAAGIGLIYESLMEGSLDEASASYGSIAESLEIVDENRAVIFNLRPQARWHDGKPITSEDVVFSFNALKTRGHPFYRAYWSAVPSIEAIGPHQVKFKLSDPTNRELPGILGQLTVLPKHYYEIHDFEKTTLEPPLGSGPYRVAALDAGRSITYERVADHWGRNLPVNAGRHNFDRIRYDYYLDQT